jgi:hypothetical protein
MYPANLLKYSEPIDKVQYAWIDGASEVITLPDGANITLPAFASNETITYTIVTNVETLRVKLGDDAIEVSDTMLDAKNELDITKVTHKLALQKWNQIVEEKLRGGVKIRFLFTG